MTIPFELNGLHATQDGYPVLRGVSLRIQKGENVALLGPSGAGKTSMLRVLAATNLPSQGSATVLGQDLASAKQKDLRGVRSRIGFVHQDLALVPTLRVIQNVLAGRLGSMSWSQALRSLLWPSQTQKLQALALLDELGIGDKLFQRTASLSGGEQQRVALARALYQEPDALLADEPIASVDPTRARSLLELMTRVASERGLPLVVSLHQAELAQEFFGRLIGMRAGQILFDLPADRVQAQQLHELYALPDEQPTSKSERAVPQSTQAP